ncbi:AraC-type DNA-binding protein [Bacteroidales bacterium WCE2008]|nr:AraC-type DNA-binding protein [Bacteroidales bacterium WCE2008]
MRSHAICILILSLVLSGCKRIEPKVSTYQNLLSEIDVRAENSDSILSVIDNLNESKAISNQMADLLRAKVYDHNGRRRISEHYYQRAYEGWSDPPEDWDAYFASAYGLSALRLLKCDPEGAIQVLTVALDKETEIRNENPTLRSHFLSILAQCQGQLNRPEMMIKTELECYDLLLKNKHQSNADINLIINTNIIFDYYLSEGSFDNARLWMERWENEMKEYEAEGDPELFREYRGSLQMGKVLLLKKTGHEKEAAKLFESIPVDDLLFNFTIGQVADYLMSEERYGEAADWLELLDENVYKDDGAKMNLDNIAARLTPRFFATLKAGRSQEALEIGTQICEAIDSALIWEKTNKATELAIVYETAQKEQMWQEKQSQVKTLRFVIMFLILLLEVVAIALWLNSLARKQLREKNRDLYETIQKLSAKEEADIRTLQEVPEERLTHKQALFRKICTLMRESAPYTDCDLKREDLAKMLATNYNNVAEAIRECSSGQTLSEFLDGWRLKHAARMLAEQEEPIGLVAEMSGFQSRGHFNTLFREKYKMTPSEYRKAVHEDSPEIL